MTVRIERGPDRDFVALPAMAATPSAPAEAEPARSPVAIQNWTGPTIQATALHIIANAVATAMVTVVAASLFITIAPWLLGSLRPHVVTSGSMSPALDVGDVVLVEPIDSVVSPGAVIMFESGDGSVIHRVVEVTDAGYVTKGDSNTEADAAIVPHEEVKGVGVLVSPFLGLPRVWANNGNWIALATVLVALSAALVFSRRRWIEPRTPSAREWVWRPL